MDIKIKSTDFALTPETSNYLHGRLEAAQKLVGDDEAARFEVELGRVTGHSRQADDQWFAEINVITRGNRFRATAHAASVNVAIDEVKDEIVRILRKEKRLYRRLWRRSGGAIKHFLKFGREE